MPQPAGRAERPREVIVSDGPFAPGVSGNALSTTNAVMALATDPIGRCTVARWVATVPSRLVARAKLPTDGVGIAGATPGSATSVAGTSMTTEGRGGGAASLTATTVAVVTSTAAKTATKSAHTHDHRRATAVRLAYARLPVACVRAFHDDAAHAAASHHPA